MKDLLPIGSVVTLKEGTKRLMIIGRLQQNVRTKKVYDYAGCLLLIAKLFEYESE